MKWKSKREPWTGYRVIERFLIFPMELDHEWRWWEKAKIRQVYINAGGWGGWTSEGWADDEPVGTSYKAKDGTPYQVWNA